jgi:hypothetical protein
VDGKVKVGADSHPEHDQWETVGWAPRFGTGETAAEKADTTTLLDHQTFLESKLDEKFYGGMPLSASHIACNLSKAVS